MWREGHLKTWVIFVAAVLGSFAWCEGIHFQKVGAYVHRVIFTFCPPLLKVRRSKSDYFIASGPRSQIFSHKFTIVSNYTKFVTINNVTVVRLLNLDPSISKNEEIDSIPLKNHGLMPCYFPINCIKEGIFNVYFYVSPCLMTPKIKQIVH